MEKDKFKPLKVDISLLKNYLKTNQYILKTTYNNGFGFEYVTYSMFIGLTASANGDFEDNIKPINKGLKENDENRVEEEVREIIKLNGGAEYGV